MDLSTVIAVAALAVSLVSVAFREVRERRREKVRIEAQERSLAENVAAWVQVFDAADESTVEISAKNDTKLPVRHASIRAVNTASAITHFAYHPVIPPGVTLTHTEALKIDDEGADHLRASLTFVDSSQKRWHRPLSGNLEELPATFTIYGGTDIQAGLERYRYLFDQEFSLDVSVRADHTGQDLRHFFESPDYHASRCDAIVGPHDWLGSFRENALLRTVPVPYGKPRDALTREAFQLFQVGTESEGVPLAYDTAVLFMNQDLYAGPVPTSAEELFALGRQYARPADATSEVQGVSFSMGDKPGEGDPFMMWPLLSALGGSLFTPVGDHAWTPTVEALHSPTLESALTQLQALAHAYPESFRSTMSQREARKLFSEGAIPFHIDTSGARAEIAADVNIKLGPLPRNPDTARPGLSAIYGFYFRQTPVSWDESGNGPVRDDYTRNGEDFLHFHLGSRTLCSHLSHALGMPVINRSGLVDDGVDAGVVLESCENARPMPNLPVMPQVWRVLGRLIMDCTTHVAVGAALKKASADLGPLLASSTTPPDR